jgi:hypothetical protein
VAFIPSLNVAGQLGLRYRLTAMVHLFSEVQAGRDLAIRDGTPWERAAANVSSLHASLGVLFEH